MSEMIPSRPDITTTLSYLKPILEEYENNLYDNLRTSIFPGFFHGKCENDGVTPPGCPNPDCPVVCGTPGSLVHFYPKLRYIAYNATRHLIDEILHPGSITYEKVYQSVSDACNSPTRRSGAFFSRSARAVLRKRDEVTIKRRFHDIMTSFLPVLEAACGGTGNGTTNGLPLCSWEEEMKNYILSFP